MVWLLYLLEPLWSTEVNIIAGVDQLPLFSFGRDDHQPDCRGLFIYPWDQLYTANYRGLIYSYNLWQGFNICIPNIKIPYRPWHTYWCGGISKTTGRSGSFRETRDYGVALICRRFQNPGSRTTIFFWVGCRTTIILVEVYHHPKGTTICLMVATTSREIEGHILMQGGKDTFCWRPLVDNIHGINLPGCISIYLQSGPGLRSLWMELWGPYKWRKING